MNFSLVQILVEEDGAGDENEEGDEDVVEYDNDTESCETRVTPGPPSNPSYNARSVNRSSSEDDEKENGEGNGSRARKGLRPQPKKKDFFIFISM